MENYLRSAVFEHQFWLQVLGDHSRFIHDSLYPSEKEDISKAASFIHQFDQLGSEAKTGVQKQHSSNNFPLLTSPFFHLYSIYSPWKHFMRKSELFKCAKNIK